MDINISNKIVLRTAIAAGLAIIALVGSVYIMGFENTLAFLYEIALDIFEKFLRLPERKIV
jgi:hypothetical protein